MNRSPAHGVCACMCVIRIVKLTVRVWVYKYWNLGAWLVGKSPRMNGSV